LADASYHHDPVGTDETVPDRVFCFAFEIPREMTGAQNSPTDF
jgi:hypothetical protein